MRRAETDSDSIPDEVETEYELFARHRYRSTENQHLLVQYAQEELRNGSRVVAEDSAGWLAVVPFWATWPFEVLGVSARSIHGSNRSPARRLS